MKSIVKALILLALMISPAQPAMAVEFEDGQQVPAHIVLPLLAWVEAQVGVRTAGAPDVLASRTYLTEIVSRMGRTAGRAKAVYVGGRVVLDHRAFDSEDSTQMSLLVHELVHYAQSFKRGGWSCPQQKEVEAYTLQNLWLEQQGHAPYVRASWIERVSSCSGRNGVDLAMAN